MKLIVIYRDGGMYESSMHFVLAESAIEASRILGFIDPGSVVIGTAKHIDWANGEPLTHTIDDEIRSNHRLYEFDEETVKARLAAAPTDILLRLRESDLYFDKEVRRWLRQELRRREPKKARTK